MFGGIGIFLRIKALAGLAGEVAPILLEHFPENSIILALSKYSRSFAEVIRILSRYAPKISPELFADDDFYEDARPDLTDVEKIIVNRNE